MRHASKINGLSHIAFTKLDVLDDLDKIKICVAYELDGKEVTDFPTDIHRLERCKPVYIEMPGWKEDTTQIKDYKKLPKNAKKYVEKLAKLANAKIYLVSVGAERGQIIRI
jgi:adenylosuccinate synthase